MRQSLIFDLETLICKKRSSPKQLKSNAIFMVGVREGVSPSTPMARVEGRSHSWDHKGCALIDPLFCYEINTANDIQRALTNIGARKKISLAF